MVTGRNGAIVSFTHSADDDDATSKDARRRLVLIQTKTVHVELRGHISSARTRAVANVCGRDLGEVKEGKGSRARCCTAADDDCARDGRGTCAGIQ